MCIINDNKERPFLGRLGQEAEDRQADQERIWGRPAREPKCDADRVVLGLRETVQKAEEWGTQLQKRRKRELHFRFDARRPGDLVLAPGLYGVPEQSRLADARFAL
jgi:hypothetical protein